MAPSPLPDDYFGHVDDEEARRREEQARIDEKSRIRKEKAERKRQEVKEIAAKKEEKERQDALARAYQTRLEEKILGTTLEQDIARWDDAVRLFRTMTRLGEDEDGIVDATLYGEQFKAYFEVEEEVRRGSQRRVVQRRRQR